MTVLSVEEYNSIFGNKGIWADSPDPDETASELARISEKKGRNRESSRRGQAFESLIMLQCDLYKKQGIAVIDKTPEPFRVSRKTGNGMFEGRFTKTKAQPDFQGTLKGGRSVLIEAKSTSKDRIGFQVLTEHQRDLLEQHSEAGAVCLVLCEIGERHFAVPWEEWRDMKEKYGHQYLKPEEIATYEVTEHNGAVLPFLEICLDRAV